MQTIKAAINEEITNRIGRGLGKIAGAEDSRFTELASSLGELRQTTSDLATALVNANLPSLISRVEDAVSRAELVNVQLDGLNRRISALDERLKVIEDAISL